MLSVFISVCTLLVLFMLQLRSISIFHQKGNRLFALFFSQARLVAFLLFLIALIAKLSFKKIATVVFTPGCSHGYRPLVNCLEFFFTIFATKYLPLSC